MRRSAVYEWNFPAQMIAIRTAEAEGSADRGRSTANFSAPIYLIERPLLQAMRPTAWRADPAHRRAGPHRRAVRGLPAGGAVGFPGHDPRDRHHRSARAADRHPDLEPHARGARRAEAPLPLSLGRLPRFRPRARDPARPRARGGRDAVAPDRGLRAGLRTEDIFKKPGVAETIDWAKCLLALDVVDLSPEVISDTLGAILKYQDDIQKIQGSEAKRILDEAKAAHRGGLSPSLGGNAPPRGSPRGIGPRRSRGGARRSPVHGSKVASEKYPGGVGAEPPRGTSWLITRRSPKPASGAEHRPFRARAAAGRPAGGAGAGDRRHSCGGGGRASPSGWISTGRCMPAS